ncbi:MAG: Flp pilus assembly complex ATPase component TadA, partial [Lentisphaerae bacterium]|nr:Flp pilus assembly complex ATPase component TadA [Lentisphaerota bacterium]
MSNTSNNTQQSDEIWRLAREYGLDALTSVDETAFDSSLIANLPVEWARSNALLPIRLNGEACVLTHDPAAVSQQEDLALLVGEDLRPILAPQDLIAECIEKAYYNKGDTAEGFLQEMGEVAGSAKDRTTDGDLLQVAEKAPVTQLINLILLEAVKKRASDIHFEPFEANLRVRYRVDGVLYNQTAPPKHLEDALVSRLKVMAHMDISEKRLPQDGMARVRVGDRAIDVRVSTVPVAEGERVVLRLLDRDSALLPLK